MKVSKALLAVSSLLAVAVSSYGADTPFLTGFALNSPSLRNDFGGFVGMQLTVGASALPVTSIGRVCVAGNNQTHTVKFVVASTGADVAGASAAVNMAGCTPGQFAYASPAGSVTLAANTAYYLVSQETVAGDRWYDFGTVTATTDAAVNGSVYFYNGNYIASNSSNSSYVPPNFIYTPPAPNPNPPFITNYSSNSNLRNDYSGFVGMQLTVGATAIPLNSLGRVCVAGNSQTHTVKFVLASNGTDVPGGTAQVSMAGCTPGQFVYALTASPVTLGAGTSYFLVSQEAAGGDRWYDYGPVTASAGATVTNAVYTAGGNYIPTGSANNSYVPPNFLSGNVVTGPVNVTVQTNPSGLHFTVAGVDHTSPYSFTSPAGTPFTIATTSPQNVGGGTQQAFSNWSDGLAISHSVAPTSDTTYVATFSTQYLLTTNVLPGGGGTIIASPASASGYYNAGTPITVTASPNSGFQFDHWGPGDASGTGVTQPLTMSAARSVTANFAPGPPPSATSFLSDGFTTNQQLRIDYSGFVGMKLTVGATALPVVSLGRICIAGNTQIHTVKFVTASSGTDVPNATAQVNMAGCTPGNFVYVAPIGSVTLLANTAYYLVSQETAGGDRWYDQGPVSPTADAVVNNSVYTIGSNYININTTNTSYVPPSFQYQIGPPPPPINVTVQTSPSGLSFTVNGNTHTSPYTFPSPAGAPITIATISPQNASAGSQQVFTSWSDLGAISHTVSPTVDTTYTANFTTQYQLTTSVTGTGSIAASPSSATGYYNSGTPVQITATTMNGSTFTGFSGDLTGTTNPQTISMTSPHSVTANFTTTVTPQHFVTGYALNSPPLRNNFDGFAGMVLTVGSSNLPVTGLGRICAGASTQQHIVKFVNSDGSDVPGATATLNMNGCTVGQFVYGPPASAVTLSANTKYFLVSQEFFAGDLWYDQGTISTTNVATVNSSVYYSGSYIPINSANTSYVPTDFQYTVGPPPPPSPTTEFVTTFNLDHPPLRNDFSGFVGMKFTVGGATIGAASIGRLCAAGNAQSHAVEFVNASNNVVVGSATVNMAGCTPGQFVYVNLDQGIVNLQAGSAYYLASLETSGGDQWYDRGALTTTTVASVNNAVYFYGGSWNPFNGPNGSYVPPNFRYVTPGTPLLEIFSSQAPNVFGSPSWNGYLSNALQALQSGKTAIGNPGTDPTAYATIATENQHQNIVSPFNSWQGLASPTGAFSNELGNRLHFGLHIRGNGVQFSLSSLTFDMESTDTGGAFGPNTFQYNGDFSDTGDPSNVYDSSRVGINYGPDHIKGTGDDVIITSGPATQTVDELIYVGIGNAPAPADFGCTAGTNQDQLDCTAQYYTTIMPFNITMNYTLSGAQANATVPFVATGGAAVRNHQVIFNRQAAITTASRPATQKYK